MFCQRLILCVLVPRALPIEYTTREPGISQKKIDFDANTVTFWMIVIQAAYLLYTDCSVFVLSVIKSNNLGVEQWTIDYNLEPGAFRH